MRQRVLSVGACLLVTLCYPNLKLSCFLKNNTLIMLCYEYFLIPILTSDLHCFTCLWIEEK